MSESALTDEELAWWEDEEPEDLLPSFLSAKKLTVHYGQSRERGHKKTLQTKLHVDRKLSGKVLMAEKGVTPLEYLQNVMEGNEPSTFEQRQAAIAILPYRHKKMPTDIQASGPDGGPIPSDMNVRVTFVKP